MPGVRARLEAPGERGALTELWGAASPALTLTGCHGRRDPPTARPGGGGSGSAAGVHHVARALGEDVRSRVRGSCPPTSGPRLVAPGRLGNLLTARGSDSLHAGS